MTRYIRKSYWLLIFTAFVYTGGGEVWAQTAEPQEIEATSDAEAIPLLPTDTHGENGDGSLTSQTDAVQAATAPAADAAMHSSADETDPAAYGISDELVDGEAAPHSDAHDKSSAGLPQLDPKWYPSQLFWLFLTYTILYFAFSRNVLPSLSGIIENRRDHIKNDLDQAEKLRAQAEKVHKAYETVVNEAQHKTADLVQAVDQDIKKKSNDQSAAFRDKATKAIQDTEKSIEKAKKDAMDEMTAIAAEIASQAAKKIVGISTDVDQAKTVVRNISKKAA